MTASAEHSSAVVQEFPRPRAGPVVAAVAGAALCVVLGEIVLVNQSLGVAAARVLVFAIPIAVGAWAWNQPEYRRFGALLVAAGFAWSLTTLSESSNDVLYSIGRVAGWPTEAVVIFLALAFPSGRLTSALDRWVVFFAFAVALVLYVPTALIIERYPEPSPWASCGLDCPDNAFFALNEEPAFVDGRLFKLRELAAVGMFVVVAILLAGRFRRASRLMRRTLTPVLVVAILGCATVVPYTAARAIWDEGPAVDALGWLIVLGLPGMAVAFLIGLLRARLSVGAALQQLARRLRSDPGADELRDILADTLEDPSLEVAYWLPGPPAHWVRADGRSVVLPTADPGRAYTEVSHARGRVAALVHDTALIRQRGMVEAAGSFALAALENHRLGAQVHASMAELRESRARIQAAADSERRRIERDLHDGAQQRLVALRIRLELAGELMRTDPENGSKLVRELGAEANAALEEVRSLASGIYPSLLADRGLVDALRAAARHASVPATVEAQGVGRYPAEVESAVYFCCLEAVQNAVKHAAGTTQITISLVMDGVLRFGVRDDGGGFREESVSSGAGLANMRDRLAAVGGELTVSSSPGEGTSVEGWIGLDGSATPSPG